MAGSWEELGFPNLGMKFTLKEKLVTTTLKIVRADGHPYVDLRLEGRRLVFFCCLCFAPCFGEMNLFNHLNGNRHAKNLVGPKETLMKPNPWPFNDGVYFFHVNESQEVGKDLDVSDREKHKLLDSGPEDAEDLAVVSYGSNLDGNGGASCLENIEKHANCDGVPCDGTIHELVIPSVLQNNSVSDLVVRRMGMGLICASYIERNGVSSEIHKMWCEWLGKKDISSRGVGAVSEHDFAIVTFPYDYNLGREVILEYPRYSLPCSSCSEADNANSTVKKLKASSDPVDASVGNQYGSSEEDSESNNSNSLVLLSKSDRRRMLDQFSVASERACSICIEKFLPRKDVAALLNRRTGKFACSSRNSTGAFHLFHVSCLIHWILHCEVEMHNNKSADEPIVEDERPKKRRKRKSKKNEQNPEEQNSVKKTIYCPDCQGSGIEIHKKVLEKPTISLDKIYKSKIKLCRAHKAWLKNPQRLENCATGFTFPTDSDEMRKEHLAPLKMLTFYRATN